MLHPMPELTILAKSDHVRDAGIRLRQLIDALGISYVQAAREMGITKNHLGNWMRGASYPGAYELYRFCRYRGLNFDWVFLGDPAALPYPVARKLLQQEDEQASSSVADNLASEKIAQRS